MVKHYYSYSKYFGLFIINLNIPCQAKCLKQLIDIIDHIKGQIVTQILLSTMFEPAENN